MNFEGAIGLYTFLIGAFVAVLGTFIAFGLGASMMMSGIACMWLGVVPTKSR